MYSHYHTGCGDDVLYTLVLHHTQTTIATTLLPLQRLHPEHSSRTGIISQPGRSVVSVRSALSPHRCSLEASLPRLAVVIYACALQCSCSSSLPCSCASSLPCSCSSSLPCRRDPGSHLLWAAYLQARACVCVYVCVLACALSMFVCVCV